jgi:predicted nucleotidyltransferase
MFVTVESHNESLQQQTILSQIRSVLPDLQAKYEVSKLSDFGFVVRNEMTGGSDDDFLVEFAQTPSFFKFVELEVELSSILRREVDLVIKQALCSRIGWRVRAEAKPI